MRYLRNCGLEFRYCGIAKQAEFLVIGWAIFSMVVSNYSIFLRGFTVFGIPLAALQSFFPHAYTSVTRPALMVSVIPCPVAVLGSFTLLVPNNIPMIICYAVDPINGNN